jgi:hypothetical protein
VNSLSQKKPTCKVIPIRPDLDLVVAHVLDALKNIDPLPLKPAVTVPEPLLSQLESLAESICLKRCHRRSDACYTCYLEEFMLNLGVRP